MKRKLLFHLICILLCFSIVLNNSCLIYANSTGGISNPDDYQTYPNGMRKYSLNEALSAGLAETAKTVVFLASGLFAVAQGDGNAAMENLVNWMQVAGWGDEKMFVVDDNGKMSTLPTFKQMVTEYKNYYIQHNPSSANTQPISIKTVPADLVLSKHASLWDAPLYDVASSLGIGSILSTQGVTIETNDFCYFSHVGSNETEVLHVRKNVFYRDKYCYLFSYGALPTSINVGENAPAPGNYMCTQYYPNLGRNYWQADSVYNFKICKDGSIKNENYDGSCMNFIKVNDLTYICLDIATKDGLSFFHFSSYADGVQYYDSLYSSLNKAGLTINNYNQIYKYISDPEEPGSVVVTPNNVVDFEPNDFTIDTPSVPSGPGDSGGGSDSGGGTSTGDSSGIIKAINNLYDMLEQKLNKIISQIRTNNILTGLDLLNDIFNDYIKDFATATTELGETVKSKFPFCLPFVIVGALALTNKSATVPKFTIPFKYDTIGVNYDIVIDFSDSKWSACRNVIYYFTLFFYMFGLIYLTFKASKVKE